MATPQLSTACQSCNGQSVRERTETNWILYEREKQAWQNNHPDSTYEQYQAAMRELAKACGV